MAFAIFDPAVIAALLAGVPQPALVVPALTVTTTPARDCSRRATTSAGFDCCLNIALWKVRPTAPLNHPAQSPDAAADQKEGR